MLTAVVMEVVVIAAAVVVLVVVVVVVVLVILVLVMLVATVALVIMITAIVIAAQLIVRVVADSRFEVWGFGMANFAVSHFPLASAAQKLVRVQVVPSPCQLPRIAQPVPWLL